MLLIVCWISCSSPLTATWSDDGLGAALIDETGAWRARIEVEQWYRDGQTEPDVAWVVSWPEPHRREPYVLRAVVESPALVADGAERRSWLLDEAARAMETPPPAPLPFQVPLPTPSSPDEWGEHLDLQISCWDDAFGDVANAATVMEPHGEYLRYRALTEALERIYALDSSLNILWGSLPVGRRERMSRTTDQRAQQAAEHNAQSPLVFDLATDVGFSAYVRRRQDGQPYRHWSEVLLAGVSQARFFKQSDGHEASSCTPRPPHRWISANTALARHPDGSGARARTGRAAVSMTRGDDRTTSCWPPMMWSACWAT